MMRKFAAVFITLTLLLTAVMPSAVFAEPDTPVFSVTNAQGEAGDEVTVYLEMQDSPTIHSFLLQIHYDQSMLDLIAAEEVETPDKDPLNLVMSCDPETNEPLPNEDEDGNLFFAITYLGLWGLSDAEGISGTRTLAKLTFKIKDDAALGDTAISISYNADDVFEIISPEYMEIENVYFVTKSGTVSVVCNHTYGDWAASDEEEHEQSCAKCGDTQTALHVWDAGVVTEEPTCVDPGELTCTCDACGREKTEAIDPTGEHTYGEWYESVPATEETPGEERRDCAHCDAYETREIPVIDAILWGDADGNGRVNSRDVTHLRRYFADYDYDTGTSSVEIFAGADADGNGRVNSRDVTHLRRYFADYDYETGTSSVVLGPSK